jgi:hypothetical protein
MKYDNIISLINNESIQNILPFLISVFCLYSCVSYYNNCYNKTLYEINTNCCNKTQLLERGMYLVCIQVFIDLFIKKSYAMKLHHIFVLSFLFYNNYYSVSSNDRIILLFPLIKTEISSVFLIFKKWIPENTIVHHINSTLFFVTFFKFRIIDFYNQILYNNIHYNYIVDKYSKKNIFMSMFLLFSLYGLYILNIYWFLIINKIIFKKLFSQFNSDLISQYFCSYLLFLNIPLSIYIYSYKQNVKFIFDILGITLLSICSYKYHYNIYHNLKIKKIEEYITEKPSNSIINFYKTNIVYFYNDLLSINIRSFLNVISNYYNNGLVIYTTGFSALIHLSLVYLSTTQIMKFLGTEKVDNFPFYVFRTNNIIPILLDVIFVFYNSSLEIAIPFLLTNILIVLILVIKPFYKLTHIIFHILLILQNYYLCISNLNSK